MEWLAALISGIVAIGTTIATVSASEKQSNANIQAQKEFNDSQSLSAKISEAKENGISPLAVLGQNASNAVVSAPQSNADYSGFSSFGNSLMNSITGLAKEKYSVDKTTKSNEDIQRMKNKNAEDIANLEIGSNEKQTLQKLNNALSIANSKNATDKEIQESIRQAQFNLENLRSVNSDFNQDKINKFAKEENSRQMAHAMEMLEKNLENAEKERDVRIKQQLIHEAFTTFDTLVYTAGSVFGGNVSAAISNMGRSPIGF